MKKKRADMNPVPSKPERPRAERTSINADTPKLPDVEHLLARLETIKQQIDAGVYNAPEHSAELCSIANALVLLAGHSRSINKNFIAFLIELAATETLDELAEHDLHDRTTP